MSVTIKVARNHNMTMIHCFLFITFSHISPCSAVFCNDQWKRSLMVIKISHLICSQFFQNSKLFQAQNYQSIVRHI